MSRANEVFVSSAAPIDAGYRQYRPDASAAGMRTRANTEQARVHSGKQTTDAEAIIARLVNQYFCSSTKAFLLLLKSISIKSRPASPRLATLQE